MPHGGPSCVIASPVVSDNETASPVDLDLDALLPPGKTFRLNGLTYWLPGETPLEWLIESLQMRDKFESSQRIATSEPLPDDASAGQQAKRDAEEKQAEHDMVAALESMRALIHSLLDDGGKLEGREYPRLGHESISMIMALAIGGKMVDIPVPENAPEDTEPEQQLQTPEDVVRETLTYGAGEGGSEDPTTPKPTETAAQEQEPVDVEAAPV